MLTEEQKRLIVEIGYSQIGQTYPKGYHCGNFMLDIYRKVNFSTNFNDYPRFSFQEIWEEKAIGYPLFLHRRGTKCKKRITHLGIIFPCNKVLHYSRWINGQPGFYQVFLSSFDEIFNIYDFVEPI